MSKDGAVPVVVGRGYYRNSLYHWRGELRQRLRGQMMRLEAMEGGKHPDTADQLRLVGLTQEFIGRLDAEIKGMSSSEQ